MKRPSPENFETATLLRDITAADLAMDSVDDEGYPSDHVIGPKGSTVQILAREDFADSVEVTGFTNDPFATGYISLDDIDGGNPIVESPSGWSYRASQENGDEVDCRECGNSLNDDLPIVNDGEGYAYHAPCLSADDETED